MNKVSVRLGDIETDAAIREIRQLVFVEEQKVSAELEWDGKDAEATHFLLFLHEANAEPKAIGTARLLANGKVGRVAILAEYRKQGFGRVLMLEIMKHAQQVGMPRLNLSAQTHALKFYQDLGFKLCSPVYMEAGIPHRDMRWNPDDNDCH